MKQLLSSGIKMRNVFTYMQTNEPANDATCSDLSRWVLEAVANSERCGICVREHGQVSYATGVVPFLKYVHLIEECGPNEKGDFVMYKVVRTKYKYTRDLSVLERLASEFEKLDPRLRATVEDAPHLIDVYEALCDILKRSFFKKAVPTGADVAGLICRKICHQRCLDPTELRDWEAVTMSTLIRVCPDEHRHLEQWGGDLTADCLEGYCDSPFHASMWSCLCEGLRLPSGDQLTAEWVNLYAVQVENALAAFVSAHGMAPCPETLIQNAFYETETGKNFEVQRTCSSFLGQSRSGQLKMLDRGWAFLGVFPMCRAPLGLPLRPMPPKAKQRGSVADVNISRAMWITREDFEQIFTAAESELQEGIGAAERARTLMEQAIALQRQAQRDFESSLAAVGALAQKYADASGRPPIAEAASRALPSNPMESQPQSEVASGTRVAKASTPPMPTATQVADGADGADSDDSSSATLRTGASPLPTSPNRAASSFGHPMRARRRSRVDGDETQSPPKRRRTTDS